MFCVQVHNRSLPACGTAVLVEVDWVEKSDLFVITFFPVVSVQVPRTTGAQERLLRQQTVRQRVQRCLRPSLPAGIRTAWLQPQDLPRGRHVVGSGDRVCA